MSRVVLFHSGLGLRPAVATWKAALEAAGHEVLTPDLYDGEVFDDLDAGVKKRDALGLEELSRRADAAVESLPGELVYAGFSLGAAAAQALALNRPGARGAILMHAALPLQAFGLTRWPASLPAQIHTSVDDPWVDMPVVDAIAASADKCVEVLTYAGAAHLFADHDYVDHRPEHARQMLDRVLAFLSRLD